MQFKEYLKEKQITIYALAKGTGIPYSTVNDFVNGKTSIDRMQYGAVKAISNYLGIRPEGLEILCASENLHLEFHIQVKNKSYYLAYRDEIGKLRSEKICKVNPVNTRYVQTMAERMWERLKAAEVMKNWKHSIT